jgi:RXT2-like, N-terminal
LVKFPQLLTLWQTITHAGFERDIISRKPTVYDDDGFEIDSEDEDEEAQAALAAAAEFYPYADIKLESERLFYDFRGCQTN